MSIYNLVYGFTSYLLRLQRIREEGPNSTREIRIQPRELPMISITSSFRTHGERFSNVALKLWYLSDSRNPLEIRKAADPSPRRMHIPSYRRQFADKFTSTPSPRTLEEPCNLDHVMGRVAGTRDRVTESSLIKASVKPLSRCPTPISCLFQALSPSLQASVVPRALRIQVGLYQSPPRSAGLPWIVQSSARPPPPPLGPP